MKHTHENAGVPTPEKTTKIPIAMENVIFAHCKLDFTHDQSAVVEGSIVIGRDGHAHVVTKITVNECGNREFWSDSVCLTEQYRSPHNMLTKSPFFAHEFKVE